MMSNIALHMALNEITTYLRLLQEHLTIDDLDYFCYEYNIIKEDCDIYKILNCEYSNLPFLDYYIQYFGTPYESVENFKEDLHYSFKDVLNKENLKIKITINKEEFIKYYNTDQLNFFIFSTINQFVNNFSKDPKTNFNKLNLNKKVKIFILDFDINQQLSNNYMTILSISKIDITNSEEISSSAIEKYNRIQNNFDYKKIDFYTDIPHFWDINYEDSTLLEQSILTFFSLISNKKLEDPNTFLIRGYHNLEFTIDSKFQTVNTKILINLIDFTLDSEKHHDKILILRSVITTYLNNFSTTEHFCTQLNSIYDSTKYQFSMYVQNEVKIFIEQKNQVLNETHNLARQISTLTSQVTNSLRNAIISLLATLIASSIPDIGEKLDNKLILLILCAVFVLYLGTSLFNVFITHNQLEGSLENFSHYLKHISSNSLEGLDYESLKNEFIQNEITNFNRTKLLANIIYIILLGAVSCAFGYLLSS